MALERTDLQERYELREVLGRGGMGVVYRALDRLMKREVALKTILDIENPATLQLFYKEWSILATMVHPNVINIYDIGEFDQDGVKKPFFVMPLLPGVTLDRLIKDGSPRLSVAGVLEIITQAAHGLHAAHEQGLVHRDVKPSNIFVMDDNSVKIIDFGIAREASGQSKTTLKGTLYYIAPEQLQNKPPSALSDLFALGVVTYEALTRRRPFQGASESDVVEAILHHSPPPISGINSEVGYSISQVVHKAMAKQPWHRFYNMREFAGALLKASRNEPIEYFDSTRIKPRLERAAKSFEAGDCVFASEVLGELEAEGHLDPEIALLRGRVDEAVRQTRIRQMLESARRFFEATEYPLALRKIQEALDLDPNDAGALSLKSQIEKERRDRKISEWIALARQHLDHQAFRQAREALENVVQVKPNETEALGLLAEIGRRENEVSRVRDEKSHLYQQAKQAWEKGEVTSALSKLESLVSMDRDLPESDSGRSSTYQNFYNQVHSEHDAIKNSYEEARRNLAGDDFEAAMAVCRQALAKYPNHALFQALKFDVEDRRRQKLSQVIAETDRRVEQEPDLDRKSAILEEALKLYPGEAHFDGALRLVRDKRDLVNSIVAKAGFFEERGQFNDALDQWQILKSIHDQQPGLAFEIQRLIQRRDQQAHENSKSRWVEQTDKYLEGGDYTRALQTIASALLEFPGEPELLELEKLVRQRIERGSQALHCLVQSREFSDKGEPEKALVALRQAYQLDSRNSVIRTVMINSLLEQARNLVDSDWEAAEAMAQEVLAVKPNYAAAQSLVSRIADRKREDFVAGRLAQARRMQTDNDVDGAAALVAQGLAAYPNEPRLLQLQNTLRRAQAEKQPQTARESLLEQDATTITSTPAQPSGNPTAPAADDPTVDLSASVSQVPLTAERPQNPGPAVPVAQLPTPASAPLPGEAAAPTSPPALQKLPTGPVTPLLPPPAPPPLLEESALSTSPPVLQGPPAGPVTPLSPPPLVPPAPRPLVTGQSRRLLVGTGAAAGLLVLIAFAVTFTRHSKKVPPPVTPVAAKYQVWLHSTPDGAEIKINGAACGSGRCSLELPPGNYALEAQLTGYQGTASTITVDANSSKDIILTLNPLPPRVAIFTDMQNGVVTLDGTPVGQIQDGGAELRNLIPGPHTLSVQSGDSSVSVPVEIVPGGPPKLSGQIDAKNLRAFVVAGYGPQAHLFGSGTGYKVTLDGQQIGDLGSDGMDLQSLVPGTHSLALDSRTNQHDKIVFESQPSATLYVSLGASENLGTLYVESNEDQAQLYVNGQKYKRETKFGRLVLSLAPKKYTVALQKDGFTPTPEQSVEIKRGVESKLTFNMLAAKAVLTIHGSPPGTDVQVDGVHLGNTNATGDFQTSTIDPGRHTVTLKHDKFKTLQSDQIFLITKPVELVGELDPIGTNGTLRFDVTPVGVDFHVRIHRDGDPQDREVTGTSASVPEGHYTVSASAPGFTTTTTAVQVTAGGAVVASLPLRKAESPKAPPKTAPSAASFGLVDWAKTGLWSQKGSMITHAGGNYIVAPIDIAQGTVQFTVLSIKGKRVAWVVGYQDDKDYFLYELDDKNLTRYQENHGSKSGQIKVPHGLDRKEPMSITVTITPRSITVTALRAGQWVTLDSWDVVGTLVHGKFGFHIPGSDEIGLQEFRLTSN